MSALVEPRFGGRSGPRTRLLSRRSRLRAARARLPARTAPARRTRTPRRSRIRTTRTSASWETEGTPASPRTLTGPRTAARRHAPSMLARCRPGNAFLPGTWRAPRGAHLAGTPAAVRAGRDKSAFTPDSGARVNPIRFRIHLGFVLHSDSGLRVWGSWFRNANGVSDIDLISLRAARTADRDGASARLVPASKRAVCAGVCRRFDPIRRSWCVPAVVWYGDGASERAVVSRS